MKKISIVLGLGLLLITSWALFSFRSVAAEKVEVTVSSTKPAKFDLHMYQEGKVLKALTTPYTFSVENEMAQYILKSSNPKSELKIVVQRDGKKTLSASWSLIVLTRNHQELSTFGLNLKE